jgi:hypothetical protein
MVEINEWCVQLLKNRRQALNLMKRFKASRSQCLSEMSATEELLTEDLQAH